MSGMETHEENLERVRSRIQRAVIGFCDTHPRFHADELRRYVIRETGVAAPASSDRVLRDLRQKGRLDYRVVSRRESLYEVIKDEENGQASEAAPALPAG